MSRQALTFILLLSAGTPAIAGGATPSDHWVVTQLTGEARVVHPGLQPASLKVNAEIAPGDTLVTGDTGRATLVHGGDYILVAPHSQLRLPTGAQPNGFTRVVETLGTMLFKVQHTGIPHFAVETPMLAAVVKGTTFTVVVEQQRSAVQVIQGVVQVTAAQGGMSQLVEGGRTVFVERRNPTVLLDADKPTNGSPSASSVKVSASAPSLVGSAADLTGLVRVETAPAAHLAAVTSQVDASAQPSATLAVAPKAGQSPVVTVAVGSGTAPVLSSGSTPTVSVAVSTPSVTAPSVSVPSAVATPSVTIPSVTVADVSTPAVTVPSVATPSVTVPSVTVPSVSTPEVTVPSVSTPQVTVPSVTVAIVTTPSVTVPSVTTPSVTVPNVTTPSVTVPAVTVPTVTVPAVTVPAVTVPSVTVPAIPLLGH